MSRMIGAVALVLVAAGCSTQGSAGVAPLEPPASRTSTPPTTPASQSIAEQAFLGVIRQAIPKFTSVPDALLLREAHLICAILRPHDTASFETVVSSLTHRMQLTGLQAGELVGGSTAAFCPGKTSAVPHS